MKTKTKKLPETILAIDRHNGWIAPDGKIHRCKFGLHGYEAENILKRRFDRSYKSRAADVLLKMGWITFGGIGFHPFNGWKEPTQAQLNTIFEICQEAGWDYPHYLEG